MFHLLDTESKKDLCIDKFKKSDLTLLEKWSGIDYMFIVLSLEQCIFF